MANLTRQQITDRALETLGIKAAGQSALAEDGNRGLEAFDAVYYRLRKEGLSPFATSAVPEWAQTQLINLIAWELAPGFGVSAGRSQLLAEAAQRATRDLERQVAGFRHPIPIKTDYY